MEEKKRKTYTELVNLYREEGLSEELVIRQLNIKPVCVNISILKSEYEDIHTHKYYELLYVKKGKLHYLVNNNEYHLMAGDIMLIPKNIPHKLIAFEENESSRYILLCSQNFLNKYSTKQTNLLTIFNNAIKNNIYLLKFYETQKIELERTLELTSNMMFEDTYGIDLMYIYKFIKVLIDITDLSLQNTQEKNLTNSSNKIVNNIIEYIHENISKKINLEEIANKLALSVSRISHIFKEETGISILKYINKKRLSLAKDLIKQGETFINISLKCGFQDYTSFFRTFKKEFNITPGEYSKKIRIFD